MMKKYYVNKNFIPVSFVKLKESYTNRLNRRSLMLLSILVLMLFPNTISFIAYDSKDDKKEETSHNVNFNDESFYKWMDIINYDTVGTFNNGNATIYINGVDRFKEILKNKDIIVVNVEDIGDKKFKIQINQE